MNRPHPAAIALGVLCVLFLLGLGGAVAAMQAAEDSSSGRGSRRRPRWCACGRSSTSATRSRCRRWAAQPRHPRSASCWCGACRGCFERGTHDERGRVDAEPRGARPCRTRRRRSRTPRRRPRSRCVDRPAAPVDDLASPLAARQVDELPPECRLARHHGSPT